MAVNLTALQVMQDAPVIPVIVLNDVAHAVPMARALVAGGIRMLEVTLRTPQALACMEAIAKEVPGAVVGAWLIGMVEELTVLLLAPNYRTAIGFVVILIVLTIRPSGLFGEKSG